MGVLASKAGICLATASEREWSRTTPGFQIAKRADDWSARLAIGAPGFEPGTSCAQGRRATGLRYAPRFSTPQLTTLGPFTLSPPSRILPPTGAPRTVRRVYGRRRVHLERKMKAGLRFALAVAVGAPVHVAAQSPDTSAIARAAASLTLRSIGPGLMSGRIADIAVHPDRSGHLVRGRRLGRGLEDHQRRHHLDARSSTTSPPTRSARSLSTPPTPTWSGSAPARTSAGATSAGATGSTAAATPAAPGSGWASRGREHIGRILVDPRDGNRGLVAAEGPLWAAGGERGVYRTTDGGATWTPVLQIDENTGVTDLEFDPVQPRRGLRRRLPAPPPRLGVPRRRARLGASGSPPTTARPGAS